MKRSHKILALIVGLFVALIALTLLSSVTPSPSDPKPTAPHSGDVTINPVPKESA